jgi:hypothetical protein
MDISPTLGMAISTTSSNNNNMAVATLHYYLWVVVVVVVAPEVDTPSARSTRATR